MRLLHGKSESLSIRLPWLRLLGHLGTELGSAALPTLVECPLCRETTLQVLADHWGGEWFSCSSCDKAGDAIQLAARAWEITIPAAIRKLSRDGFDIPTDQEAIRYYIDHYVKHRKRITSLWERSRRNHFHNSTLLQRLVHDLRFHSEVPVSRQAEGPGQLIGYSNKPEVRKAYFPGMKIVKGRYSGSGYTLFPWKKGDDLLVFPFYDVPGRISGFYFIGRKGEPQDQIFRAITYARRKSMEAGLHFHPAALDVSEHHWDNTVFALRDPVMAMRLHARHFETSKLVLPLFVWQERGLAPGGNQQFISNAGTLHAWRMLDKRRVVFWMPKLDPVVMRQAAAVDGFISMHGPKNCSQQELQEYMWRRSPVDMLRHLASTARPWIEIFASAVTELTDSLVEQLTLEITRSSQDIPQLLNRLPRKPRERLRRLLSRTDVPIVVPFRTDQVTEKNEKWFVASFNRPREENILNGILRIDHVIYHPRTGASYLEGRLIAKGNVVPFCDSEKLIKKDTLEWIRNLARERGHMLVDGRQAWNKRLLEIAYAFHEPKYVSGVDIIGWDVDSARFVLPKFSIHLGGRVEPALTDLLSVDVPALDLSRPVKLSPEDFDSVAADNSTSRTFWACLAPLVANILAPAFARKPSGIAFVGRGAHWIGVKLSKAVGCQQKIIPRTHIGDVISKYYEAEFVHNWPLFVGTNEPVTWGKWWGFWTNKYDRGYRNCGVSLPRLAGMLKAAQGGWHVVAVPSASFLFPEPWKTLAAKFVPAYLHDLTRRNLKLRTTATVPTWLDDVLQDISDFVEHLGADPAAVHAAREQLWPDTEYGHARAFAHVLGLLYREGQCPIAPEGFQQGNRLQLVRRPEGLFVPDSPLREHLMSRHYLLPEHDTISKALTLEGVLVEEQENGWVIDDNWWRDSQRESNLLLP